MRLPLLIFLLLVPLYGSAEEPDQVRRFLQTRQLLGQVFFASESTRLSSAAREKLDTAAELLAGKLRTGAVARIEGFASPPGQADDNLNLSFQRALAVSEYLRSRHQLRIAVFLTGYGESADNADKIGKSRRVDIAVYEKNRATKALFDDLVTAERHTHQ